MPWKRPANEIVRLLGQSAARPSDCQCRGPRLASLFVLEGLAASLGRVLRLGPPASSDCFLRALAEERRRAGDGRTLRRAVGDCSERIPLGSDLDARARWLQDGTTSAELERLDPRVHCDRIHHHLLATYRVESRIAETLAINRVACQRSLSLFLRSTGEAEHNARARFVDTYALFANFFEWGSGSVRGSAAVRRMNEIHGRYYLPNEGMKYVLLNTAFTWLDAIDRVARRPLRPVERLGFFHAYVTLGRALRIEGLSHDVQEMRAFFSDQNARSARPAPFKTRTFEAFVRNSLGSVVADWPALRLSLSVGMDDDYRAALGYPTPAEAESQAVVAAIAQLSARLGNATQGVYLRSLEERAGAGRSPNELGVSRRSTRLPALTSSGDNAGYPSGLCPVSAARPVSETPLPAYAWHQIRRRVAGGAAWLVIEGDVYDVGPLLDHHPGGETPLREHLGRDATRAFRSAGHGPLTETLRLNFRVGRLAVPRRTAD